MRVVIAGATPLGLAAARKLIEGRHEVVIVDRDRERLDALGDDLDCGFIQGDATLPSTLRDAYGDGADALLPLTNHDENNVLMALVGRSIGFGRVAPKIVNPELRPICRELALSDAVFADETIAGKLIEGLEDDAAIDAEMAVGGGLKLVRIAADDRAAGPREALTPPSDARLVAIEREEEALLEGEASEIRAGDRLLFLARPAAVSSLEERFGAASPEDGPPDADRVARPSTKEKR